MLQIVSHPAFIIVAAYLAFAVPLIWWSFTHFD